MLSIVLLTLLIAACIAGVVAARHLRVLSWHLADTHLQLQCLFDNMAEGVIVLNHDHHGVLESSNNATISTTLYGRVESWNTGPEKMLGYGAQEILGTSAARLLPDGGDDIVAEFLDRVRLGGTIEPFDEPAVMRDGRTIHVDNSMSPIRGADDATQGTALYLPFASTSTSGQRKLAKPLGQLSLSSGRKILLVDDAADLLDVASTFLHTLGYQTLVATNGQQAFRLVAEHSDIEVIMTDIIMPGGMNGVELSQKVMEANPAIKVIYVSGLSEEALAEKTFGIGTHILLNKPYHLSELSDAVTSALQAEVEPALIH